MKLVLSLHTIGLQNNSGLSSVPNGRGLGKMRFHSELHTASPSQILILHIHASVRIGTARRPHLLVFSIRLDDIFVFHAQLGTGVCMTTHSPALPAVRLSDGISALSEPQRDCVMDGR